MRVIDWLALFALALLWGVSFFFMELAIPSFAPFTLVLVRVGVAGCLMLLLLMLARQKPWRMIRARWRVYAVLGFFGTAFPFLCFSWGQRYIESGLASILNALTPLCVLTLALMLGREQYNFARALGILLGFIGVAVLVEPDASASELGGIIAATVAALSYAIATNYAWGRVSQYPARENACGQLIFASLYMLPFSLFEQPWQAEFHFSAVAALLGLALFSTFFAYLVYYFLLSNAGGVNAMLAVLLIPVIAVTLGVVFLDERFDSKIFIGGGLILVGIILTDAKLRRLLRDLITHPLRRQ